jgi:GH25 family lysozyme M1 (1,4-beta-N-acetylmuramidase)
VLPRARAGYLLGVDIGRDQGVVDHHALVAAGVGFVVIRATDGIHDTDVRFAGNVAGAISASLDFGLYDVIEPYALNQVPLQVANFVSRAKDCGSTIPHWLDWELAHGQAGSVAIQAAALWCDEVEDALGQAVMVYTGPSFIETLEKLAGAQLKGEDRLAGVDPATRSALTRLARRPLAIAHYGCTFGQPTVPPPWVDWTIWQAGPSGETLPGRSTAVDVDWFRGDIAALRALTVLAA